MQRYIKFTFRLPDKFSRSYVPLSLIKVLNHNRDVHTMEYVVQAQSVIPKELGLFRNN